MYSRPKFIIITPVNINECLIEITVLSVFSALIIHSFHTRNTA